HVEDAAGPGEDGRDHEDDELVKPDVVAEKLGAQPVLANGDHHHAAMRVHQQAAAKIAGEGDEEGEVVEGIAHEDEIAELERRNSRHAVVPTELDVTDAPLVPGGLAEEGLEQQGEDEGQDRYDPALD